VGDEGSDYQRNVVLPGAVRLLGVKPGEEVLDIACGQGVLCRMLARTGVPTVGVDAAADVLTSSRGAGRQGRMGEMPLRIRRLLVVLCL
jgi:2-polyprenyl-3-methyl-5-hydroxy-6-metoxy-1,4-benzoquinol methylase